MIGNLGFMEMLVIFLVALVVFGPQRLPEIARSIGKTIAQFRRTANNVRDTVEREVASTELGAAVTEARSLARGVSGRDDYLPSIPPHAAETEPEASVGEPVESTAQASVRTTPKPS